MGQASMHGERPCRSITYVVGIAWGKVLWMAVRSLSSSLNGSGTVTGQTLTHSPHEVQSGVTPRARWRMGHQLTGRAARRGLGGWGWGPQPHRDEAPGPRAISSQGAPLGADSAVGAGDPNRTAMRPPAEEPSAQRARR